MNPILVAMALGGAAKAGYGLWQRYQAGHLKEDNYVPGAVKENKALADQQMNATTYPGQVQEQQMADQATANAVGQVEKNAKSSSDVLNSAGLIQARGTNVAKQIGARYQAFKQQALSRLMGVNSQIAGFQDRNHQKYLAAKAALLGAGTQNIWGGVNDATEGYAQAYTLSKMTPGAPGSTPQFNWKNMGAVGGFDNPVEQGYA